MKKILTAIPVLLLLSAGSVSAQSSPASASKVMTVEEANRLNGTAQPTINGIPYSQYKAQQDALNRQEAKAEKQDIMPVTEFQKPKGLEPSIVTTNDTKATPAVSKPVKVQGTSLEVKSVKPVAENKQVSSGPSSTDAAPASLAPKAETKSKTSGQ